MFDPVSSIFISDYAINNFGIAYFCGILVGWLIKNPANAGFFNYMAERKGFEPLIRFPVYTISSRAP